MDKVMWFGTEQRASFIPAPLASAEMSQVGWEASAQLLGGGAMQRNSFASHREYVFEWSDGSTRSAQQLMESYANGTFGRGLIYFHDPLNYTMNVLPPFYADPSMAVGFEAPPLVPDVQPTVSTTGASANLLPITTVAYTVPAIGIANSNPVFVPIPTGYDLHVGAIYSKTGTAGAFVSPVTLAGSTLAPIALTALTVSATNLHPDTFSSSLYSGVRVWVGKTSAAASTVTITAMTARLYKTGTVGDYTQWFAGHGHTGCRFVGKPTYIANSGVQGGQVGYACSFTETGAWE